MLAHSQHPLSKGYRHEVAGTGMLSEGPLTVSEATILQEIYEGTAKVPQETVVKFVAGW